LADAKYRDERRLNMTGRPVNDPVELLWGQRPSGTRGPRRSLSLPGIVKTAITLADTDGLTAVSLQRVAERLGLTKMSLYRYVRSKDDLIALMIDTAVEQVPDLEGVAGWRNRAERFTDAISEVWTRHPWLPWAAVGDRAMGPQETAWVQAGLTVFDDTGLTARERLDAVALLFGQLRSTYSVARAGTLPWNRPAGQRTTFQRALDDRPDEFAVLRRIMGEAETSPDNGRSFGLQTILDGLEKLVESRYG
jgi:AcrR family transcriptional regulator